MPQFFVRSLDGKNSFGTVKKDGGFGWSHAKNAAVFDSAEQAREKSLAAMEASFASALAAFAKAEAKGEIEFFDFYTGQTRVGWPNLSMFLPEWAADHFKAKDPKALAKAAPGRSSGHYAWDAGKAAASFRVDSKSTLEDILQSFETFYARSADGWLGGPRTKQGWGGFEWRESFTDAQGFPSLDAVKDALRSVGSLDGHSILRTRSVFTEATPVGESHDDVSLGIGAACEARDIESTIVEAAKSRLDDMKATAASAPKAPRNRL